MEISRADWSEYVRKLSAIDSRAASLMEEYIAAHGYDDPDALVRYAHALATKYGEASGALACEMYDEVAAAQGAVVPPAVPAETATYGETAKAIRGTWNVSPASVPATTGRLVKQTGADTILKNAQRDGAQFAWVPGGDTCVFCMTLASRGWQYMSKNALKKGHAEHIHANCDCTYAIRFDGKSGVKGYDPDKYKKMYDNAEGSTPQEKINSMRREQYAENKDRINARKRMRYAEKNNKNSIAIQSNFGILKNNRSQIKMNLQLFASGKERADQFGHGWQEASLSETIDKFAKGAGGVLNDDGSKRIFHIDGGERQIVYDIDGNYFRIENLSRVGRRRYDDINGNDVSNKTIGKITTGRSREEYERLTHFRCKEEGENK